MASWRGLAVPCPEPALESIRCSQENVYRPKMGTDAVFVTVGFSWTWRCTVDIFLAGSCSRVFL